MSFRSRPASGAVKGRYRIGDRQRRDVLADIVTSLQRAIPSIGQEPAASSVHAGLAWLRAPEREGRPVDIHIRLASSELELEVVPNGAHPVEGAPPVQPR